MAGAAMGDNQQPGWEGTAGTSRVTKVLLPWVCPGGARCTAQPGAVGCGGTCRAEWAGGAVERLGGPRVRWRGLGLPVVPGSPSPCPVSCSPKQPGLVGALIFSFLPQQARALPAFSQSCGGPQVSNGARSHVLGKPRRMGPGSQPVPGLQVESAPAASAAPPPRALFCPRGNTSGSSNSPGSCSGATQPCLGTVGSWGDKQQQNLCLTRGIAEPLNTGCFAKMDTLGPQDPQTLHPVTFSCPRPCFCAAVSD